MFGIFEVYTYERLYNQSTYLFICIYIYQPQLVSENRKSEASTGNKDFLEKDVPADVGSFFFWVFYRRWGRSVNLPKVLTFFPHVDPVASEAIRNFHVWLHVMKRLFLFFGEGNFKQDVKGNCWYICIYIYAVSDDLETAISV